MFDYALPEHRSEVREGRKEGAGHRGGTKGWGKEAGQRSGFGSVNGWYSFFFELLLANKAPEAFKWCEFTFKCFARTTCVY